jgi:hypothetical protein
MLLLKTRRLIPCNFDIHSLLTFADAVIDVYWYVGVYGGKAHNLSFLKEN